MKENRKMKNNFYGIDLGTTYSCIAYIDDDGAPRTLKNSEGMLTTPSAVYFESEDKIVVGDEAKEYAIAEPEKSVTFIKRDMGKNYKRRIANGEYTPQEISAKILRKIVNDANEYLKSQNLIKEDIKQVVITCPAYFGMAEKEATRQAGEIAGLEVLDIINEPTAAAINYGVIESGTNKCVLVYDLGGGTFDVTIIRIADNKIDVLCTGGEPTLGGKDWDEACVQEFVRRWGMENNTMEDISDDLETNSELMAAAEKLKKSLTAKDKAPVVINHDGKRLKFEVTRAEYDQFTAPLLDKTIELTDDCIKNTMAKAPGFTRDSITDIILVGGSSKMPQVKERLQKEYHIPVKIFEPDEGVAKGAALYALNRAQYDIVVETISKATGKSKNQITTELAKENGDLAEEAAKAGIDVTDVGRLVISNVSSRTYGICVVDENGKDAVENFIYQNDDIPAVITKDFGTYKDGQPNAKMDIYESSVQRTEKNELIKDLSLTKLVAPVTMRFKEPVPAGTPIQITMTMENSGLMHIRAVEGKNQSELDVDIDIQNGCNKEETEKAAQRTLRADIS